MSSLKDQVIIKSSRKLGKFYIRVICANTSQVNKLSQLFPDIFFSGFEGAILLPDITESSCYNQMQIEIFKKLDSNNFHPIFC